jgi:arginase family enzyme
VSTLRARCPECRTLTAVAVDDGYECHACGRAFSAGLVRVPRAWGAGGEAMAAAARIELPYPEAAVVAEPALAAQNDALVAVLPRRPIVLGGCCCAHVGAVRGLAGRCGRVAVVWLDAHGDLNTHETSPSGNEWGMPLRMLLDDGVVRPEDVALVGARNLDPPEAEYLRATGIDDDVERALAGTDALYVALDLDVLAPDELPVFVPEPGGPTVAELEERLRGLAARRRVTGAGLTGLLPAADAAVLARLAAALGL